MSNLNNFLLWLQRGLFRVAGLGDWIFMLQSGTPRLAIEMCVFNPYYKSYGAGAPLTDKQRNFNNAMKAACITIEKNYGMTSTLFQICCVEGGNKLAKKSIALEQLRVFHLMVNCYVCFNGDQAVTKHLIWCLLVVRTI